MLPLALRVAPDDEMALEAAVGSSNDAIVTCDKRDFVGVERLGIRIMAPVELLHELGVRR
jgi:predicted nucleic acid-binding protein